MLNSSATEPNPVPESVGLLGLPTRTMEMVRAPGIAAMGADGEVPAGVDVGAVVVGDAGRVLVGAAVAVTVD